MAPMEKSIFSEFNEGLEDELYFSTAMWNKTQEKVENLEEEFKQLFENS